MVTNNPIHSFENAIDLAQAATVAILAAAEQAIAERGVFKIVLAGGTTPKQIYQLLRQSDAQWGKWLIFFGDERCLPTDDAERNSLMAMQAWLSHVTLSASQIFPMPAEQGAERAAQEYAEHIAPHLPFDLVLLGMGEDGHTASLFPCHPHDANEWVHAVHRAPKPPADRVSLSVKALSNSHEVMFLVSGAGKKQAFKLWQDGVKLPVAQVHALKTTAIYIDYAALGRD